MKKILIISLLSCVLLFGIAGCASESEEPEQSEDTIEFAMSGGYPPFNYFNEENQLVGFDVDVGKEVAERLGKEYAPITTAWDGIIEGLRGGRYDGILGSMAITEKRLEVVNFSDPYYYSGAQLIVRNDSGINTPDDLENAVVGVATGTTFEKDAKAIPGVSDVRLYEDDNQTLMELNVERIDGVITDRIVGLNAFREAGFDFKLCGSVLRTEKMAVAINKENEQLLEDINTVLAEMREDGTLKEISEKWFDTDITIE